uniref:Superoxide dismutase [Cu-Zn] n=1 Tax=Steinernema glaseri TaxID=37863 RepID=A0A1I7ZST1_9BILA
MKSLVLLLSLLASASAQQVISARAFVFKAPPKGSAFDVHALETVGVIDFTQEGGVVKINGTVSGLTPGQHGFHVHQKGDISNACLASGGHFNPTHKNHGAPTDADRHVGDLGNIVAPASGPTTIHLEDKLVALNGPNSILGRAIVIHEKADDLGKGGTEASRTTGDAGARVACGVIGISSA